MSPIGTQSLNLSDFTSSGMPGISILVVKQGQSLLELNHGLADVRAGISCTAQTNYRLASVTKQFTATLILMANERNLLRLDQSIRDALPELPNLCDDVTVHHLLNHTHGLSDYESLISENQRTALADADVLSMLMSNGASYFVPGAKFRYSNTGYALLALIAERVFSFKFPEALRLFLFEPLQMKATLAYVSGGPEITNRAYGYTVDDDEVLRTDQSMTSTVLGDGGIYSNTQDLAKWDAALYPGRLLQPDTCALAFSPSTITTRPEIGYGYGWFVQQIHGEKVLFHTGETTGFRNAYFRCPSRHLSVIVLTNRYSEEAPRVARQLMEDFW